VDMSSIFTQDSEGFRAFQYLFVRSVSS
jgi:hypothetical protein